MACYIIGHIANYKFDFIDHITSIILFEREFKYSRAAPRSRFYFSITTQFKI